MSLRQVTSDIDKVLIGIEVQDAVNIVVAYIQRTQRFHEGPEAAYSWWAKLEQTEKVDILAKALKEAL